MFWQKKRQSSTTGYIEEPVPVGVCVKCSHILARDVLQVVRKVSLPIPPHGESVPISRSLYCEECHQKHLHTSRDALILEGVVDGLLVYELVLRNTDEWSRPQFCWRLVPPPQ